MPDLNYHHLRYFRAVARAGTLTEAARDLNLSQSALSTQIRTLEARLGRALFAREGRGLRLTEAGRIALTHADRIFGTGARLLAALAGEGEARPLGVGAEATLSRNLQLRFLAPVLGGATAVRLRSGDAASLVAGLEALSLDVALVTEPPVAGPDILSHRIAAQPVALHGRAQDVAAPDLATLLARGRFVVPSEPGLRAGFLGLAERLGTRPAIAAEVDDMAMVRLLAREGAGIAVAPSVVVADELAAGRLVTAPFDLGLEKRFHALTLRRDYPHPALAALLPAGGAGGGGGRAR